MSVEPVLVTGAAGFVGAEVVARLLAGGHRVRGTARNPDAADHLRALPGASEGLTLVAADLLQPASLESAVHGCRQVIHSASPFVLDAADPQRDLVDPAVEGTLAMLRACQAAGGVQRVVLTSSMAAITDEPRAAPLSEQDWNVKSTLRRNPYYLSKTLAERAAWRFVEEQRPSFDLVAINPWTVIGPSRAPALNVSNAVFVDLTKGVFPGYVSLSFAMVDVRDVAEAHVRAMEIPAASGRYVCASEVLGMREIVAVIRGAGYDQGYKLPRRGLDSAVGNVAVRLFSYLEPRGRGTFVRTHLGRVPAFDNAKIRRELGLTFRDVRATIVETMRDLERWGHIRPRPAVAAA
jgi:dihydroflavonol-4-reductase